MFPQQRDRSWQRVRETELAEAQLRPQPKEEESGQNDIPLADHPLVDMYDKNFTGPGRWYFKKWLARADRYAPIMLPILVER